MWIHFDDIPIGGEFQAFFLGTYTKVADNSARYNPTGMIEHRIWLLHGFANGYFFVKGSPRVLY